MKKNPWSSHCSIIIKGSELYFENLLKRAIEANKNK